MSNSTTRARRFAGLALLAAGLGCHARTAPQADSPMLAVKNSSDFQVNVFAVPSVPAARIRLGSISPLSDGSLRLPQSALAAGGELRVMVDPIGSTTEWISPAVNVSSGSHACLRVMADVDGSLQRSTLTTALGDGTACP